MAGGSDSLAHTDTAPRCHLSQARSKSKRRRQKEQDGNANGSPRVRAGIPAERCWAPAAALGTALEQEDGGERALGFNGPSFLSGHCVMSCPVPT